MPIDLHTYQQAAIDKFFGNNGNLLVALPVGLGKTVVGLSIIKRIFEKEGSDLKVLIIVPADLRFNFKDSITQFKLTDIKTTIVTDKNLFEQEYEQNNVIIVSYNFMIMYSDIIIKHKFRLLIIDEMHRSKNHQVITYQTLSKVRKDIPMMLGLTASFFSNTMVEFLALISIISRDQRIIRFANQFIKMGFANKPGLLAQIFLGAKPSSPIPIGIKNINTFKNLVGKWIYIPSEETLRAVGHGPKPVQQTVQVEITKLEFDAYMYALGKLPKQYAQKILKNELSETDLRVIGKAFIMVIQQVLLSPDYISTREPTRARPGSKINWIADKIQNTTNKSIVFTPFSIFGAQLMNRTLRERGIETRLYTGDVSKEERARIRNEFENGNVQTLCLTAAGTEGLNLPSCNEVYFLSMTYNPEVMEQVMGRALRITSHNDHVDIWYLIAKFHNKSTIDSNILRIAENKKLMKKAIIKVLGESDELVDENTAAGLASGQSYETLDKKTPIIPVVYPNER